MHFDQFSPYLLILYLYRKKSRTYLFRLNLYKNTEKLELKRVITLAGSVCFCDMRLASSATRHPPLPPRLGLCSLHSEGCVLSSVTVGA